MSNLTFMDNSEINKAHETGRKAVKLLRKGKFCEAAVCHLTAATILSEFLERISTSDSRVAIGRSLEEQVRYHRRQAELSDILRKIADNTMDRSHNSTDVSSVGSGHIASWKSTGDRGAHNDIIRTIEEADSLLKILSGKVGPGPNTESTSKDNVESEKPKEFAKRPKNDTDVIEELRTLNCNLGSLVDKLLRELQDAQEENRLLKKRLAAYESAAKENTNSTSSTQSTVSSASLKLAYDQLPVRQLPELAPLETPNFDFTTMP